MKSWNRVVYGAVLLTFACAAAWAQSTVKIGRSEISLPAAGQWNVTDVTQEGVKYTGDIAGTIPLETKRLSYKSSEGLTKLVMVTAMTKGAVNARMSWENNCINFKPSDNLFVKDEGSVNRLDCLVVVRVPGIQSFLSAAKGLQPLFATQTPHTIGGYYVQYSKGLDNGAQTASYLFLSNDFKGIEEGDVSNSSKIPDPVIRWATEFAKANNRALTSFSGQWALPPLSFN